MLEYISYLIIVSQVLQAGQEQFPHIYLILEFPHLGFDLFDSLIYGHILPLIGLMPSQRMQ